MRSERVELSDIFINNSCITKTDGCNMNTDGVDTVYANYITFLRWTVESGDVRNYCSHRICPSLTVSH